MTLLGVGNDGGWFLCWRCAWLLCWLVLCALTPGLLFRYCWCLVCELCLLTAVWVDCRCVLSFVFLGGARRMELSPCNTEMTEETHLHPGTKTMINPEEDPDNSKTQRT